MNGRRGDDELSAADEREGEGGEGTDDGGWQHRRAPDVPAEYRLRVRIFGVWRDYGLHGREIAAAMAADHRRRGREAEVFHERIAPASDAMPGQIGLLFRPREKDTAGD